MFANGSELFRGMYNLIQRNAWMRTTADPQSPAQGAWLEAAPGRSFTLEYPAYNLIDCRPVNPAWAVANVLHFFAGREDAGPLLRYNAHAERFLTRTADGFLWKGAYGAIGLHKLKECVAHLRSQPMSRRAVVDMGGLWGVQQDYNRPCCWSSLHLLQSRYGLDLVVYQRSLNLFGVMPYDLVALTNILSYAAWATKIPTGRLHWCVGSLHMREGDSSSADGYRHRGVILDPETLDKPDVCWDILDRPNKYPEYKALQHETAS